MTVGVNKRDYILLTDMVCNREGGFDFIEKWLHNKYVV